MSSGPPISILVIDDNPGSIELLTAALAGPNAEVLTASDPERGIEIVASRRPEIVLTDLVMPKMNGLEVLRRVLAIEPCTEVILMTAYYSSETAVEAIKNGAADYLDKPVSIARIRERVAVLAENARRRQTAFRLQGELLANSECEGIVGNSPAMWEMVSKIRRVAPHYRSVLITGPTGSGKELVARALHRLSPAVSGRFVVLNCSAVVETLFESELFGHVRGSFTGAVGDKAGLMEHAHGGTLFLDEIGDMPPSTQAKLLRVLQNQEVLRVGSLTPRKVDLRVIAATNHDLALAIREKRFREDLYYRLSMVEIEVPPLANRLEDLPLLVRHFVSKFAAEYGKPIRGLTLRAEIQIRAHSWPGNVRELENVIGHAAMMTVTDMIDVQDLPPSLRKGCIQGPSDDQPGGLSLLDEQERRLIAAAIENAHGNQSEAARLLRIGRHTLRYKLKKHGL
ncbi:MAG: sigma-54 dependent transcriptional regulator [Bryobacteraceae bacterium]|nr:sigma-54 dependent transcriptional regulator [Bryobacteraceae bacterium]